MSQRAFALSWLTLKQPSRTSQFELSLVLSPNYLLPSAGQIKSSHPCFPSFQVRLQLSLITVSQGTFRGWPEAVLEDRPTWQVCGPWFKAKVLRQRRLLADFHSVTWKWISISLHWWNSLHESSSHPTHVPSCPEPHVLYPPPSSTNLPDILPSTRLELP